MKWVPIVITAVATFALAFLLHTVDVNRIEAKQIVALAAQSKTDKADCDKDKQTTMELDRGLQGNLIATSTDFNNLLLRSYATPLCVPIADAAASYVNAAPKRKLANGNGESVGLTRTFLLTYAAKVERYRQQLLTCQAYTKAVEDKTR